MEEPYRAKPHIKPGDWVIPGGNSKNLKLTPGKMYQVIKVGEPNQTQSDRYYGAYYVYVQPDVGGPDAWLNTMWVLVHDALEEYQEIMAGEKIWESIQKNSGN